MAPPPVSLGVTALLDELLADEQKLDRDMAAYTGREVADRSAEVQQAGEEEPQLSAEDQQALAELHTEVDGCLSSLEDWKEESRLRRIKLEKELEAEFGFSCHLEGEMNSLGMDESQKLEGCDSEPEDEDLSRYLGGAARREHGQRQPLCPLNDSQAYVATSSSGGKAEVRDEARRADQERIDKLRAEVEAMRQQDAYTMSSAEFASFDGDAYRMGSGSDDLGGTMPDGSRLNDWCDEVDAVLDDPSFSGLGGITRTKEGLSDMHSGLEAASSRVEADILEMEKLMAECNAAIVERRGF